MSIADGSYCLSVRDATDSETDTRGALSILSRFYEPTEAADGFSRDWEFLAKCEKPSKLRKLVWARWRDKPKGAVEEELLGLVACAWTTSTFIDYAKQRMAAGHFAFLCDCESPVLSAYLLERNNCSNAGVDYWILFLARAHIANTEVARLVRQKMFAAIEHDVVGWNINSIHVQVYGERHLNVAMAHGFDVLCHQSDSDHYLMMASRQNVDPFSETKVVDRFFSWKQPIYHLSEMEKRVALLALRGYDRQKIADHMVERGVWKSTKAYENARSYLAKVKDKIHKKVPCHDEDVLEHLRHNLWELRPSPQAHRPPRRGLNTPEGRPQDP